MSRGFVAIFLHFPEVQNFWKSVKIRQSYRQLNGGNFFEIQCVLLQQAIRERSTILSL